METLFFGLVVVGAFIILAVLLVILLRPRTNADENRFMLISQGQDRVERTLRQELAGIREELSRFGQANNARLDALRTVVDGRLRDIQSDSAQKLEQMRQTVDEKLHETLERRLGESFKLVGERLEQVQNGLGEMKNLAAGVGDLKRVLVNVKNRGTWGEIRLMTLVDDILIPSQYETNAAIKPGSADRVELALRLPGRDEEHPVFLPIDAKFPKEDYERLQEARERGDPSAAEDAAKALDKRFRLSAKDIRDKYIVPPYTTDFALMFVPSEGLFAECVSRPGLAECLQRDYRVIVAGPSTFAALLNSLQLGFRTLAVEKRTSDIRAVLETIKKEFGKFGDLLDKTKKKLQEASDTIDDAQGKTRTIRGKLNKMEEPENTRLISGDD